MVMPVGTLLIEKLHRNSLGTTAVYKRMRSRHPALAIPTPAESVDHINKSSHSRIYWNSNSLAIQGCPLRARNRRTRQLRHGRCRPSNQSSPPRRRRFGVAACLLGASGFIHGLVRRSACLKRIALRDYGLNTNPGPMAASAGIGGKSENSSGLSFMTFKIGFGSMCLVDVKCRLDNAQPMPVVSCALQSAR